MVFVSYDRTGNVLTADYAGEQTETNTYNELGLLTTVTTAEGDTLYQYDDSSRLLSVTQPSGETVSYTYDSHGNRATMTYPNGKTVKYTYDDMNRLTAVKGIDGATTKYEYDALGRRIATDGAKEDTTYSYDEVGNLVSQTTTGAYDLALEYAYDLSGRMTSESRTENGATLTSVFAYDPLGQLTSFSRSDGQSESYTYDPVGNMTAKTQNGVSTAMRYNAANQLIQSVTGNDTTKYTYDANGNLVRSENAGGARSYAYNALNLLENFTREDGYTENYSYNANRLLSEIRTSEDLTTTLTWDILYGDGVVISAAQNGQTTNYTYGLERISAKTGSTRTEYVYDGRGSVAAEVSYNNAWYTLGGGLTKKNVISKSYTPFGEQIGEAVSSFGYNGEYYNVATGMIYLRARFYEPEMNRFAQKDLLRGSAFAPQSLNRYLYVQNDPINFVDSNGRDLKSAWNTVKGAVVGAVTGAVAGTAIGAAVGGVVGGIVGAVVGGVAGGIAGAFASRSQPTQLVNNAPPAAPARATEPQSPIAYPVPPSPSPNPTTNNQQDSGGTRGRSIPLPEPGPTPCPQTRLLSMAGPSEISFGNTFNSCTISGSNGGSNNYIIFSSNYIKESDFSGQAKYQGQLLLEAGGNVTYMEVNTRQGFEDAWNSLPDKADNVIILIHSTGKALVVEDGSSTEALSITGLNSQGDAIGRIGNLSSHEIEKLSIISCNTGSLELFNNGQNGNIAQAFLGIDGIAQVTAYDGNVGFGYSGLGSVFTGITGNYYPRPSNNQNSFNEINKNNPNATPQGAIVFFPDGTYKVVGW